MKENNLRKAKVNELNRILPMVTNTMRKERKILCARDELAEKVLEENKVCQALKKVEEVPEILQNTSTDISGSSTLFAKLEEKIETLDAQIAANATNSVKLRELMEKKGETENALDEKMDRWVYLNDLNEKIQNAKQQG